MIRTFNCIRSKGCLDAFGLIALHLRRPPDDATNSDHVLLAMPFYYYHYTTTNNVYMTTMVDAQYSTKSPSPENTHSTIIINITIVRWASLLPLALSSTYPHFDQYLPNLFDLFNSLPQHHQPHTADTEEPHQIHSFRTPTHSLGSIVYDISATEAVSD